jgi:hypothetical protein
MQKIKERGNNAVPPKKYSSAYIIFGKEVNLLIVYAIFIVEARRDLKERSISQGY